MVPAPLSRRRYAAERGVTEGAIRKQIRVGRIVPTKDGKIDPAQADEAWYRWSPASARGTYPATSGPAPARRPSSSRKDEDSFDDRWLAAQLAHRPPEPDAAVDRWLAEQLEQLRAPDDRVLLLLENIRKELGALRRDLTTTAPPRMAECRAAGLELRLSVMFHQLLLAIRGEPLTVKPGVFGDDPLPLPRPLQSPPGARSAAGREMVAHPGFADERLIEKLEALSAGLRTDIAARFDPLSVTLDTLRQGQETVTGTRDDVAQLRRLVGDLVKLLADRLA
jgi:hypothetical protein